VNLSFGSLAVSSIADPRLCARWKTAVALSGEILSLESGKGNAP